MEEQATPLEQNAQQEQPQVSLPNPFLETSWADTAGASPIEQSESQAPQQQEEEYEEEIVDADEWIKREFNWESADAAKTEIEELRKLKDNATSEAEIEFANEQSAKFFKLLQDGKEDELYSFLENKKRIDRLTTSDIDRNTAADIIKLSMQQKYKDLTQDEIEYKFKKQFSIPSKPVQRDIETDDEYEERVSDWDNRVKDIETEMFIEAKLARPELEKYKNDLVLPEVDWDVQDANKQQPSPEELEMYARVLDDFKSSAKRALDSFDGLTVSVKDEEVDIPLSYSVSQEEKSLISSKLEAFAENNLDANVVLADRWLTKEGTVNTSQMVKDLALLYSEGRVGQKFANDAAAKRLAEYIKRTSNVTISSRTAQNTFGDPSAKTDMEKQIEHIWKNG
tara:strand:- start:941 stop:2128 length:1188 start_codon:yes stop_codon:yes gene_type:complete